MTVETVEIQPSSPPLDGWVKLWRAIRRHPIWRRLRPAHTKVALTILTMVGHRPVRLPNGLALAAGEVVTSHEQIADEAGWGIDRHVVGRALANLERLDFLRVRRASRKRADSARTSAHDSAHPLAGVGIVVTVTNWASYQGNENGDEAGPRTTPRGDPRRFRTRTANKQEEKKGRREERDRFSPGRPGTGEPAAVAPCVLVAFIEEFGREPTDRDRTILADLNGFPDDAVRAAFRETNEKGRDVTFARAILRFAANGAKAAVA